MDTLEETPIADISATYLTDEQFNNLYPKHPIDVSNYLLMSTFRSCNCVTLVFPVFNVFPVFTYNIHSLFHFLNLGTNGY